MDPPPGEIPCSYVIKTAGRMENFNAEKLFKSISWHCESILSCNLSPHNIFLRVLPTLRDGITTKEIASLSAAIAAKLCHVHPDYLHVAGEIEFFTLEKRTNWSIVELTERLYQYGCTLGEDELKISNQHHQNVQFYGAFLDCCINNLAVNFNFDYFSLKILQESFLMRIHGAIVESPRQFYMRVAIGIHGRSISQVLRTYRYLCSRQIIYDIPILLTAGTNKQFNLCPNYTLRPMSKSSARFPSIFTDYSTGRKNSPPVFVNPAVETSTTRSKYNLTPKFIIHVEVWDRDLKEFLLMEQNDEIYVVVWINSIFMERKRSKKKWSMMCPTQTPKLAKRWGREFDILYQKYEANGKFTEQVDANALWNFLCTKHLESRCIFLMFKDNYMQLHSEGGKCFSKRGIFISPSLQFEAKYPKLKCHSASIALPKFVNSEAKCLDMERLKIAVQRVVRDLNTIIDQSQPYSNEGANRPIAISLHGLAETFQILEISYESIEARYLTDLIFERLYFFALKSSLNIAIINKESTWRNFEPKHELNPNVEMVVGTSALDNWEELLSNIREHGTANSVFLSVMPKETEAFLLGTSESVEPMINFYRINLYGEVFEVCNQRLIQDLIDMHMWNDEVRQHFFHSQGSVQAIQCLPKEFREQYKSAWEIHPLILAKMALDRDYFIDHGQFLTFYATETNRKEIPRILEFMYENRMKSGISKCMHLSNFGIRYNFRKMMSLDTYTINCFGLVHREDEISRRTITFASLKLKQRPNLIKKSSQLPCKSKRNAKRKEKLDVEESTSTPPPKSRKRSKAKQQCQAGPSSKKRKTGSNEEKSKLVHDSELQLHLDEESRKAEATSNIQ